MGEPCGRILALFRDIVQFDWIGLFSLRQETEVDCAEDLRDAACRGHIHDLGYYPSAHRWRGANSDALFPKRQVLTLRLPLS